MNPGEIEPESARERAPEGAAEQPRRSRWRRAGLWQAIAGMALAVAVSSAFSTIEFATALSRRTNYMNRRIAALNATVRELRRTESADRRKLGTERELASEGQLFARILFAPDLRTVKLAAPEEKAGSPTGSAHPQTGVLALSESAHAALLQISGLPASGEHQVYRIWWLGRRGAPIWAGDFMVGEDGRTTTAADPPPARQNQLTIEIRLETENYSESPSGPIYLRGRIGK